MKNKKTILAAMLGFLAGASGSQDALAQGEANRATGIEELVVTAQRRSESLQDVPVAVNAYSAEMMKAMGVSDAGDLADITPGLASGAQSGSNRSYFIRGVGTNDFHLTAAPAVGQYFDDVTLTSGFHARAALFDMERVEIMKGPQNTLFGLNTTGGAINYISKKPEVGAGINGDVNVKLGSNSLLNLEGAIGFDITDNLSSRLAFQSIQEDGAFNSETNGQEYGDDDLKAYRSAFLWEPTADTSVTLNLHGMENENNSTAYRSLGTRAADGSGGVCTELGQGIPNFETDTNCLSRDGGAVLAGDPSTGDWQRITQTIGFEDISTKGVYFKIDHDFGWAAFNSTTSWDNLDFENTTDLDGGPSLGLHSMQADDRDTFQQELRLMSPDEGSFRWISGIYYLDEDADSYTGVRAPGLQFGLGNLLPNVQLNYTKENLGVYFQGEYDLTDSLTLTAGARWSDEDIVANYLPSAPNIAGSDIDTAYFADDIDQLVLAQNAGAPGFDENGYEIARQVQQKLTNKDVGYTVKLDWKATQDSMVYLSYSKGFKGSAPDIRAAFALVPVANIEAGLESSRLAPESLDAWELGYKGSFWDNRIQLDAAAFSYLYSDLQQFTTEAGIPTLDNAPESELKGLDANIKYAGDSGFHFQAGVSLLDSEVTDAEGSLFVEGAKLANSPELSYQLIASQDFQLANNGELTVLASLSYTDDRVSTTLTSGTSAIEAPYTAAAYTLLNASATYRFGDGQQYALSVFGKNLADEHYCANTVAIDGNGIFADSTSPFSVTHTLICRVTNASTRTIGASFGWEF